MGLLMDALVDAEVTCEEVKQLRLEITKLRRLLVVKLCDCRGWPAPCRWSLCFTHLPVDTGVRCNE